MAQGSLVGTADSTIVQAAYAAGMANVPRDLSGVYQNIATSYQQQMTNVGNSWGNAIKEIAKKAGEAITTFKAGRKLEDQSLAIVNKEGVSFLYNELMRNREDLKGTYKRPDAETLAEYEEQGIDWRVENRKNRQELFNEKARLESEITTLNEGWNDLATKLENGEIDELATGGNWDLINAIGAYKSVTGKTEEGYYVKPDKNENNEIVLKLYNDNPELGTGESGAVMRHGKHQTVKSKDVHKLGTPKDNQLGLDISKIINSVETNGTKVLDNTEATKNHELKRARGQISKTIGTNDEKLAIAMNNQDLYLDGRSFQNELTNSDGQGGSITSAEIWNYLQGRIPTDEQGVPLLSQEELDATGEKGFDEKDIEEHYSKFANTLLDRRDPYYDQAVTKNAFLNWVDQKSSDAFDYGWKRNSNNPDNKKEGVIDYKQALEKAKYERFMRNDPNNPKKTDDAPIYKGTQPKYTGGITGDQMQFHYDRFKNGEMKFTAEIDGEEVEQTWNRDEKTNVWTNKETGETMSGDEMLELYQSGLPEKDGKTYSLITDPNFAQYGGGIPEEYTVEDYLKGEYKGTPPGALKIKNEKISFGSGEGYQTIRSNKLYEALLSFKSENYQYKAPKDADDLLALKKQIEKDVKNQAGAVQYSGFIKELADHINKHGYKKQNIHISSLHKYIDSLIDLIDTGQEETTTEE